MSDIDLAVTRSRKLEQMLERDFGASGRGLHEKTSSVEARLPDDLVRKLRLVGENTEFRLSRQIRENTVGLDSTTVHPSLVG